MKTEDFSILDADGKERNPEETDAFFLDLNLLQVIDKLTAGWGRDVRKYYRYMPETPEAEAYRRAVYEDIKKGAAYRALMAFTERMAGVAELRREKEKVNTPIQKAVWMIREAGAYGDAYEALETDLSEAEITSEGLCRFLGILREILASEAYRSMKEHTDRVLGEIRGIRFLITYEKDRMSITLTDDPGPAAYEEWMNKVGGGENVQLQNPFKADTSLTELEYACIDVLEKKKPKFFKELEETAGRDSEFSSPVLLRFERELPFYLSFRSLQLEMEKKGFAFATPETGEGKPMEAKGLYDLALALTSFASGRKVVANDFHYGEGERFFVLTGPNQGGKTTFARSLGQLVYFTKMGLDVPAQSACVPFFPNIQTHFSVEESVETGRGKLMEELVRLAPMMESYRRDTFVIINELFTTAANYDAQIMGRRVLKHFIGLGCMGIYVTHLTELAEGSEGVVSLRAMLDENGVQTFEIRRGAAEDTACAANQVNKYRLTYEQLKERL